MLMLKLITLKFSSKFGGDGWWSVHTTLEGKLQAPVWDASSGLHRKSGQSTLLSLTAESLFALDSELILKSTTDSKFKKHEMFSSTPIGVLFAVFDSKTNKWPALRKELREIGVFPSRGIKKMMSRATLLTIKNPSFWREGERRGRERQEEREKKRGGEREREW